MTIAQKRRSPKKAATGEIEAERAVVFDTALGPMGVVESDGRLVAIRIGHQKASALREELARSFPQARFEENSRTADLLKRYAEGEIVFFDDIALDDGHLTPFRRQVTEACRAIPYGETRQYGDLASSAGNPRAYRAVGSTMACNRWPIVVPCHRVVRAGGAIGGFSAPQGIAFKEKLLQLEAASIERV